MLPLSTDLSSSVAVWATESWFVHVTVSPTLTEIVGGANAKPLMSTVVPLAADAGADADADAAGALAGAFGVADAPLLHAAAPSAADRMNAEIVRRRIGSSIEPGAARERIAPGSPQRHGRAARHDTRGSNGRFPSLEEWRRLAERYRFGDGDPRPRRHRRR